EEVFSNYTSIKENSESASDIQRKIYEFIVDYIKREGMPPTNREIGRAFNIASIGHINFHLAMLENKGLITRQPNKSRGIKLTSTSQGIPVMGTIAAGEPLDILPGNPHALAQGLSSEETYALIVRGRSMIEDHILD